MSPSPSPSPSPIMSRSNLCPPVARNPKSDDLLCQVVDWQPFDYLDDIDVMNIDSSEIEDSQEDDVTRRYCVKAFGVDSNGSSISINVTGYTPYFYARLPPSVKIDPKSSRGKFALSSIKLWIQSRFPPNSRSGIVDVTVVKKKHFWGFTNNELCDYLRIVCTNSMIWRRASYLFSKAVSIPDAWSGSKKLEVCESNIDPSLRLLHARNISPTGWVRVPAGKWNYDEDLQPTKCGMNTVCDWHDLEPYETTDTTPIIVASFDIECTSSHGDFPVPTKTYKKTADELYAMYSSLMAANKTPKEVKAEVVSAILCAFEVNPEYADDEAHEFVTDVIPKKPVNKEDIQMTIAKNVDDILTIMAGDIRMYNGERVIVESEGAKKGSGTGAKRKQSSLNSYSGFGSKSGSGSGDTITRRYNDTEDTPSDHIITCLEKRMDMIFPQLHGDPCIQIGTTMHRYGEKECFYKNVITLGTCDEIPGIEVVQCKSEKELLLKWAELINRLDPDIITGYNIFGFDLPYLYGRAKETNCVTRFMKISRIKNKECEFKEKILSSSALGDNILRYIDMEGRVYIDMMKVVQRDFNLDSYKLDNVATTFIKGKVREINQIQGSDGAGQIVMKTDSVAGIGVGNFITIGNGKKVMVSDVDINENTFALASSETEKAQSWIGNLTKEEMTWGLAKDDVTPKEIFECQAGSSADRARIAKYCVMDCALCNYLMMKLEIIANNMGMSNVCYVPFSYIFMRGQGIKIFSLVAKKCREYGFVMPVIRKNDEDDSGYEGAVVLTPKPGIYVDKPVVVLDYSSLYPSSMISENISHDTIVLDPKYDNLPGYEYVDITYDAYEGKGDKKRKVGVDTKRFVQFPNGEKGVLPNILKELLGARKSTRKKIVHKRVTTKSGEEHDGDVKMNSDGSATVTLATPDKAANVHSVVVPAEDIECVQDLYNDFQKAVLEGMQLAYKVTANSLYGQTGAKTSAISMIELAASTTAVGRGLIYKLKNFVEQDFGGETIYGDTDSCFICFPDDMYSKHPSELSTEEKVKESIDFGLKLEKAFKPLLKPPHCAEYEKVAYPFVIFSKKRYVYNKYEFDPKKYSQCSMGIVLKRRDNANVLKKVYGGIIDTILNENDIDKSVDFLRSSVKDLVDGKFEMSDLVLTKTLRATYKTPDKIVHKVLADRMMNRDPGSAPSVNDRVPFVYIEVDDKKNTLQGDRVEAPSYIVEKKLKIDYEHYITNQLQKPISQFYGLPGVLESIEGYPRSKQYFDNMYKEVLASKNGDEVKAMKRYEDLREREVSDFLFKPFLQKLDMKRNKQPAITDMWKGL